MSLAWHLTISYVYPHPTHFVAHGSRCKLGTMNMVRVNDAHITGQSINVDNSLLMRWQSASWTRFSPRRLHTKHNESLWPGRSIDRSVDRTTKLTYAAIYDKWHMPCEIYFSVLCPFIFISINFIFSVEHSRDRRKNSFQINLTLRAIELSVGAADDWMKNVIFMQIRIRRLWIDNSTQVYAHWSRVEPVTNT